MRARERERARERLREKKNRSKQQMFACAFKRPRERREQHYLKLQLCNMYSYCSLSPSPRATGSHPFLPWLRALFRDSLCSGCFQETCWVWKYIRNLGGDSREWCNFCNVMNRCMALRALGARCSHAAARLIQKAWKPENSGSTILHDLKCTILLWDQDKLWDKKAKTIHILSPAVRNTD